MPATGVDFRKTVSCVGKRCEFLAALLLLSFLLLLTGCKGGGGNGATTQASNAALDSPWAFGFNSSSSGISGSSTNALVVNANLRLSSQVQSTSMIVIRACVRPSFSSESISGSVSGSNVSLMLAFGGVTMLLTGTLSADGSSMSGTYTMSGACGNDTGTWRGNRVLPINGPYIGFLVGTNSATVLNASISGNLVSSTDGAVTGTFSINSTCFKGNLNVTGTQTGLQFGGTGTDNLGDSIEFASASNDLGFQSVTGGIQVDTGPCVGDFAELTLAAQNNGSGGGPGTNAVPILTALSPSKVAGFILSVTVYGSNFTINSQVLIDGNPVLTSFANSGALNASVNATLGPGTHLFSVRDVGGTSNSLPFTVYVPGTGSQPFLSPFSLKPANVNLMSVADVNGDSVPDLFVAGAVPGSISGTTFLGNGDGSFQSGVSTPPGGVLIADLNHDGLADLIGTDGTNLLVWPGSGDPHFGASPITVGPVSNSLVSPFPTIKVADIDGDGNPDIIVAGTIYFGRGNFQFDVVHVPFSTPFVIADFNNDGKLDIMAGPTFLNQGNRTFTSVTSGGANLGEVPVSLVVGDFNKDGLLDVASLDNYLNTVWVNYGRGDGTFVLQGEINFSDQLANPIIVGDFNADGLPDLIIGFKFNSQIALLTNDSQGGFLLSYVASGMGTADLITSDFNKDGKPDVAVLSSSGNLLVMLHK